METICGPISFVASPSSWIPQERSLLADVIGQGQEAGEKAACRVARIIEEEHIARCWPRFTDRGSERTLMETFGVGRAVVREAARILQVRGTARMFRGPSGGLRLLPVDPAHTANFVVGYCVFLGVEARHLTEAEQVLSEVRAGLRQARLRSGEHQMAFERQESTALGFFDRIIGGIRAALAENHSPAHRPAILLARDLLKRCRAGEIVLRMLHECSAEQWLQGHHLGSEEDLCFRYGVDRDAFRQAVRILESAGAAESICGRGHGLVSRAPRRGSVSRLISCLFASSGLEPAEVMDLFQRLSVHTLALAAECATPSDCDDVEAAFIQLARANAAGDKEAVLSAVFQVEDRLLAVSRNPLIHLFTQSTRGYPSAQIPRQAGILGRLNQEFLPLTGPILEAFRNNSGQDAAACQSRKIQALTAISRSSSWHADLGVSEEFFRA